MITKDEPSAISADLPDAIILSDTPAKEDGFDGNGHNRSAKALAAAVKQLAHRDGAIGLEGKWGAGKSTVIHLAENELKLLNGSGVEHHLMCYDLWAHQSDVFKRSFIEELLQWGESTKVGKKPLLSNDDISGFRDRIRDRVKTIRYDVERRFTLTGGILLLLAPLLPVLITWLSPIAFSNSTGSQVPPFGWKAAAWAAGGIYLVLAIRLVWTRFFGKNNSDEKMTWSRAASSTVSIFRNQVEDRTEKQNIREEDPSSLEFQKIFRDILRVAQGRKRRIVFVFDNIDRLPAERIVSIWAELRSVLAISDPVGSSPESSVTAIVPYDTDLISQATSKPKQVVLKHDGLGNLLSAQETSKLDAAAAELIAKTFDITISVAPPVSVDWQAFFYKKLDDLFGGAQNAERVLSPSKKYKLFALLDEQYRSENRHPTPRQIIAYINKIGTLWNQWKTIVPIESLALYVLFKDVVDRDPKSLIQTSTIPRTYIRIVDQQEWQIHLSALTFNVDPSKSAQVLLGPSIRTAIEKGDLESLSKYAKSRIFNSALAAEVTSSAQIWAQNDGGKVSNVAKALSSLDQEEEAVKICWRTLRDLLSELPPPNVETFEDYSHLSAFVLEPSNSNPKDTANTLLRWASKATASDDAFDRLHGIAWTTFVDSVISALSHRVGDAEIKEATSGITLPVDPKTNSEFVLGVATVSASSKLFGFSDLNLDVDQAAVDQVAVKLATTRPAAISKIVAVKKPAITQNAMGQMAESLANVLRTTPDVTKIGAQYVDLMLYLSRKIESVSNIIGGLVDDGTLAWHRFQSEQKKDYGASASFHVLMMRERSAAQIRANRPASNSLGDLAAAWKGLDDVVASEKPDDAYVNRLAQLTAEHELFDRLSAEAAIEPNVGLYTAVFVACLSDENIQVLEPTDMLANYNKLKSTLSDEDTKKFLSKLSISLELLVEDSDAALGIPVEVLEDSVDLKVDSFGAISEIIRLHFSRASADDWSSVLVGDDSKLRHLRFQVEKFKFQIPDGTLRMPLLSFMSDLLSGDISSVPNPSVLGFLPNSIPPASAVRFRKDFVAMLNECVVTSVGAQKFFDVFADFAKQLNFEEASDRLFEKLILPLIESGKDTASQFIATNSTALLPAFKRASSDTQTQVRNAIAALEVSSHEAFAAWAKDLRVVFALPAPTVEVDDEDPSESAG